MSEPSFLWHHGQKQLAFQWKTHFQEEARLHTLHSFVCSAMYITLNLPSTLVPVALAAFPEENHPWMLVAGAALAAVTTLCNFGSLRERYAERSDDLERLASEVELEEVRCPNSAKFSTYMIMQMYTNRTSRARAPKLVCSSVFSALDRAVQKVARKLCSSKVS